MPRIAVATVAAKNYLARVRVLAASLRRHHPELTLQVLLCDEPQGCFDPAAEPFTVLDPGTLCIPDLPAFLFRHGCKEAAAACKPWLLSHLLDRGEARVLFIDPDMLVTAPLHAAFAELERSSVVLTPHRLTPAAGAAAADAELALIRAGTLNAGFVAVRCDARAQRFLAWWRDRTFAHALDSIALGMHYDQRWLDLAPHLFEGICLLRHPGYNVAWWNLDERRLCRLHGRPFVASTPCALLHFSGYDPAVPARVSRFATDLVAGPDVTAIFEAYGAALQAQGEATVRNWPYAFDTFDNGAAVTPAMRQCFREQTQQAQRFGDPFRSAGAGSFWSAWQQGSVLPQEALG